MNQKNNKKGPKINPVTGVIAAVIVFNLLAGADANLLIILVPIIIAVVFVIVVVKITAKAKKQANRIEWKNEKDDKFAQFQQKREQAVGSSESRRDAVEENIFAPVSSDLTDQNYEDVTAASFERDRQKRIAQLNVFLKNGMIDKAEYQRLKTKYEQLTYR